MRHRQLHFLFLPPIVRKKQYDSLPVLMMWTRSVIRSSRALQPWIREHGDPSENGRLVVTMRAARAARSEDHLSQKLRTDVGERHITDFIGCDEIVFHATRHHAFHLAVLFGFDEFIYQSGCRYESHAPLLMTRCQAKPVAKWLLPVPQSPI